MTVLSLRRWIKHLGLSALSLLLAFGPQPAYGQPAPLYLPFLSRLAVVNVTACQLPEAANRSDVGLGFPRNPNRMTAVGVVRAKVLFVDFSDAPAAETPAETFARIAPGASGFYQAVSYGRMTYQLEPHLVWLRMSQPSANYGFAAYAGATFLQLQAYMQEAVTLADPVVDFTGVQAVYVMANPAAANIKYGPAFAASPGFGLTADGQTILNGAISGTDLNSWGFKWLNHEAGHTLGLVDLYDFSSSALDIHHFVGGFSMMSNIAGSAPEYLAYERWLLGWLDDTQIVCQQTPAENVTLTAIEQPGGLKAVMVPTGATTAVVVESRRALDYDTGVTKAGALVYVVDTSILSGHGPIQVYPDLADKSQAPLAAGEQVTVGKVTVQVTGAGAFSDIVRVTVAP